MKTAYLHIGTPKTGTTTIQEMLSTNRNALEAKDYFYPESPGRRNHICLTVYSSAGDSSEILNRLFIDQEMVSLYRGNMPAFQSEFRAALDKELNANKCSNVIFSNEHLCSRLFSAGELLSLKELLDPHFDKVHLIIYLRRQDEAALSLYSTLIKNGKVTLPEAFLNRPEKWLDYRMVLDLWSSVFGRDSLTVRLFDRSHFFGSTLENDFLNCVGITDGDDIKRPPRQNIGLDRQHLEFLRMINSHVPRFIETTPNKNRGNIVDLLLRVSNGPKLGISIPHALEFLSGYRASNKYVAQNYLGREHLFEEPSLGSNSEEYRGLTAAEAVAIAAELWTSKQAAFLKNKAQLDQLINK